MPNTYDLAGKSAIVTGGAKGIGRAIAELLLANGCNVIVWDANPSDIGNAISLRVDVAQPAQIAAAINQLPADRRVDILVNDAGYLGKTTTFVDHTRDGLATTMQVTQAVLPIMIRQGGGRIVNLGSLAGKEGLAGYRRLLGRECRSDLLHQGAEPRSRSTQGLRQLRCPGPDRYRHDSRPRGGRRPSHDQRQPGGASRRGERGGARRCLPLHGGKQIQHGRGLRYVWGRARY
jgi:NAD(P)-dependent dehydrogenase (short-subunit alcohol dehydrogenase family)